MTHDDERLAWRTFAAGALAGLADSLGTSTAKLAEVRDLATALLNEERRLFNAHKAEPPVTFAAARVAGAREERKRIIAAVEAERVKRRCTYGNDRDARVDALQLILDVLRELPLTGTSAQESAVGATSAQESEAPR